MLSVPIVQRLGDIRLEPIVVTIGATVLSDTLSLIEVAVCVSTYTTGFSPGGLAIQLIEIAVFVPFILIGLSRAGAWALSKMGSDEEAHFLLMLGVMAVAGAIADLINLPGIVDSSLPEARSGRFIVITETTAKPSVHQRAFHELKELAFITLYLYITIGAVILMKTAVLRTQGIEFVPWGIAIVKAVVLAKFMLIGEAMKIGGRSNTGPLIWPTLQKAFGLLVLLIVMTIIEEAVVGLFHHQSISASLNDLFGPRLEETLAGYIIMLLVLLPYCAFRVLGEALGEARLARIFFVEREPIERI